MYASQSTQIYYVQTRSGWVKKVKKLKEVFRDELNHYACKIIHAKKKKS